MYYYYDDCGEKGDHWQEQEFDDDTQALAWFTKLAEKYAVRPCILYDETYRTVCELK